MSEINQIATELHRKINDENLNFYENIEINRFSEFAKIIGLDKGVDIEEIFHLIKDTEVIAEIGAGYGRAINAILDRGYTGKVYAVERVAHLASYMCHHFANKDSVNILQDDVKKLSLPEKVNAVLWIWSGILELSLSEQQEALIRIKTQLKPHGRVILETPYQDVKFIGKKSNDNYIRFETEWGKIEAYLSTYEDIKQISKKAGFNNVEQLLYKTATDLTRVFYILS
jgi:SAM-dependent methyltransferase